MSIDLVLFSFASVAKRLTMASGGLGPMAVPWDRFTHGPSSRWDADEGEKTKGAADIL